MNHFTKKNKPLEKLRGIYFQIGLIVAGGLTLVAFEWTTPINPYLLPDNTIVYEEEWEMPTILPEKEIEKLEVKFIEAPKKSKVIEIVENDFKEKEIEIKEDIKEYKEAEYKESEWKEVEVLTEVDPIMFAQNMPHYLDCASMTEDQRKICTRDKMYKHFGKKMSIPATVKMLGKASYMAFVYFEVNKKGKISNVKILNDENHKIPRELEREAYAAVSSLPDLEPAKNHGKKVKVLYKIPINFTVR